MLEKISKKNLLVGFLGGILGITINNLVFGFLEPIIGIKKAMLFSLGMAVLFVLIILCAFLVYKFSKDKKSDV